MKKSYVPILLSLLLIFIGVSYFILRLNNVSDVLVVLLTLSLIILPPISIYLLLIRSSSMPKILVYLSFIACLGVSYLIIPSSQKYFYNPILVWFIPFLEVTIVISMVYSFIKSIILYKEGKGNDFLEITRMSLEPKLGNGFVLGAILTELGVFYYSLIGWFIKPAGTENEKVYSYHKTSQIKTIVILFSILITFEGVLFHFLIQLWSEVFAWIFTILNMYALLYMIGLYNSVRFLPHIVSFNKLIIRFGYQSSIESDIRNIESIKRANEKDEFFEKQPKETYYAMLNIDSPQYEIFLKEPALMKSAYGRKKYVKSVIFRADNPTKLIEDISSNSKSLSNGLTNNSIANIVK
ncbi:hypothetical protein [Bacillus sp. V5-8f]|uniref:hypothetical protein n=1 Tax=Bacillus sp. V5-8f TaxID=2053044 RepID=UPI0015E05F37|nr:hypothetical protein [Bacillus sp. V5-8f]